jgi:hypothetical protein
MSDNLALSDMIRNPARAPCQAPKSRPRGLPECRSEPPRDAAEPAEASGGNRPGSQTRFLSRSAGWKHRGTGR